MRATFLHAAYGNQQVTIEAEKIASALERLPVRVLEKIASGDISFTDYLEHGEEAITRAMVKRAMGLPPALSQIGKGIVGAAKANPLAAAGVVAGGAIGAKKGYDAGGLTGAVAGGIGGGVVGGAAGGAASVGIDAAKRMSTKAPPSVQQAVSNAWDHRVGETARHMRAEGVDMARGAHRKFLTGQRNMGGFRSPTISAAAPSVPDTQLSMF